MIQVDFEIASGDFIILKNGDCLRIANVDDKYLYTDNGAQFKRSHPDIAGIERHDIEKVLKDEQEADAVVIDTFVAEEAESVIEEEVIVEEVAEVAEEEAPVEEKEEEEPAPAEEEKTVEKKEPAKKKSSSKKKK